VILCDNKAAESCLDGKETKRANHIDIVHHFARSHVSIGDVRSAIYKSYITTRYGHGDGYGAA
jgi:hypothetical protein